MFHPWIGELGLLPPNAETQILSRFPLAVRKTFIGEVTAVLLANEDRQLLSSPAHVRWCLEVVGQGFALPIEDQRLISYAKRWRASGRREFESGPAGWDARARC